MFEHNYLYGKIISKKELSEEGLCDAFAKDKILNQDKVKRLQYLERMPLAILRIKTDTEKKKTVKLEDSYLKECLFAFFETKEECFYKEIQEFCDQPNSSLKKVLEQICDKKKVSNKLVYKLKPIYQ